MMKKLHNNLGIPYGCLIKQGTPSAKYNICTECGFYNVVLLEQTRDRNLELNSKIEKILKDKYKTDLS
jgi:hypothetical protein